MIEVKELFKNLVTIRFWLKYCNNDKHLLEYIELCTQFPNIQKIEIDAIYLERNYDMPFFESLEAQANARALKS